jgi:hypothetical protein
VLYPLPTILKRETWLNKGASQVGSTYGDDDCVLSLLLAAVVMRSGYVITCVTAVSAEAALQGYAIGWSGRHLLVSRSSHMQATTFGW